MINIAFPVIEDEEINAVNEVLRSGMLAQGPRVAQLEEDFAKFCGTDFAVAVNSGTAAIHAALYAAGIGPGDEVITTPFSFIATANPIIMLGATPVFVDIDKDSFNIDPKLIEQKITKKTKAIIPVHLYGQPCDWAAISDLATKHNILLIEDACQAVGAVYNGQKTGSLGDMGCFSLYATKNIMSGEGGIVTTNNKDFADKMKQFRQHGMTGPYEYADIGYNYRMTDLHAAIAVEQLKKAGRFNGHRRKVAEMYFEKLSKVSGIQLPSVSNDVEHVFHQFTLRLDDSVNRELVTSKLRESGVGSGVYYPKPLHLYPHIKKYGYGKGDFPVAEQAAAAVLSLPIHPGISEEDVISVVDNLRAALKDE